MKLRVVLYSLCAAGIISLLLLTGAGRKAGAAPKRASAANLWSLPNGLTGKLTQPIVDDFMWSTFIALNWQPKDYTQSGVVRGTPDSSQTIGKSANGDNQTVWETYQPSWYLFYGDNSDNPVPPYPASGYQPFDAGKPNPNPAPSQQTRKVLGWEPKQIGLIADIEQPSYSTDR